MAETARGQNRAMRYFIQPFIYSRTKGQAHRHRTPDLERLGSYVLAFAYLCLTFVVLVITFQFTNHQRREPDYFVGIVAKKLQPWQ